MTSNRFVQLEDLSANTQYTLKVRSINEYATPSDYSTLTFKTLGMSGAPIDFRVTLNAGGTVNFSWGAPTEGADRLKGYWFKVFALELEIPVGKNTNFGIDNTVPYIPIMVGVKCKFMDDTESDWSRLTVVPNP